MFNPGRLNKQCQQSMGELRLVLLSYLDVELLRTTTLCTRMRKGEQRNACRTT